MENRQPVVRPRAEHNISRRDIDPDALKVLYRLIRRGHVAYLVGGGVRDLLLGRQPKDFDVSTDARPNDLKRLFRNCFLIGRRFRLAHIKYGDKVIETSTFRCQPESAEGEELLQIEDNTFGTPEQDALRRDFTINGLFYDVETFSVLDYVGGLDDLQQRVIRSIGDASIRFQEDPVRMLRAIRFASRLNFSIEEKTFQAILDSCEEIRKASIPRLLEELYRLYAFRSGCPAFRLLRQTRLLEVILPEVSAYLDATDAEGDSPLWRYLDGLDRGDLIVPQPTNALMLGALFLPMMLRAADKPDSALTQKALADAYDQVVAPVCERLRVPRRVQDTLMRILTTQHRFFSKSRSKNFSKSRFAGQDFFPEALAMYELHLTATGKDFAKADEWRQLWESLMDESEPVAEGSERREGRRRRRNKKRREGAGTENGGEGQLPVDNAEEEDDLPFPGSANEPGEESAEAGESAGGPVREEAIASGHVSLVSPARAPAQKQAAHHSGPKNETSGNADSVTAESGTGGAPEHGGAAAGNGAEGERSTRSRRRRRRKKKRSGDEAGSNAQPGQGDSPEGNEANAGQNGERRSGTERQGGNADSRPAEHTSRRQPNPSADPAEERSDRQDSRESEKDLTAAPLTPFEMIKEVQKGGKKDRKKRPRRGDKDKQIIHDYRPTDAGPSYDKGSEAPHWLDEI